MNKLLQHFLEKLGKQLIHKIEILGQVILLSLQIFSCFFKKPFSVKNLIDQMVKIGFDSISVVFMTALSVGMVMTLQIGFMITTKMPGGEDLLGSIIGISFVRELGPTFTAIIVTGRVGSSIAAELGTMKVTEQIDALITLSANPVQYLAVPRFIASVTMLPLLTVIADIVGVFGGGLTAMSVFDQNMSQFMEQATSFVQMEDFLGGLFKASIFGGIISVVSCFEGFQAYGGAEGVGNSTTRTVVISSIAIIVSDYFMNSMIIKIFGGI